MNKVTDLQWLEHFLSKEINDCEDSSEDENTNTNIEIQNELKGNNELNSDYQVDNQNESNKPGISILKSKS